jgi:hypothetical protein
MTELSEGLIVAEQCLKEMLQADDENDFDFYVKHFELNYLVNFSRDYTQLMNIRLWNLTCAI